MPFNSKVLFVHIPKTAGTTIETALGLKSAECLYDFQGKKADQIVTRQHLFASEYRNIIDNVDNLYRVSVVRNPYDRLVSAYHFAGKNIYIPSKIKT